MKAQAPPAPLTTPWSSLHDQTALGTTQQTTPCGCHHGQHPRLEGRRRRVFQDVKAETETRGSLSGVVVSLCLSLSTLVTFIHYVVSGVLFPSASWTNIPPLLSSASEWFCLVGIGVGGVTTMDGTSSELWSHEWRRAAAVDLRPRMRGPERPLLGSTEGVGRKW